MRRRKERRGEERRERETVSVVAYASPLWAPTEAEEVVGRRVQVCEPKGPGSADNPPMKPPVDPLLTRATLRVPSPAATALLTQ